jgi:hypothetical protein
VAPTISGQIAFKYPGALAETARSIATQCASTATGLSTAVREVALLGHLDTEIEARLFLCIV